MKLSLGNIVTMLLAIVMIVFGANKLVPFLTMPTPANPSSAMMSFFGAMGGTYLGKFVGLTELVGGLMLLSDRTRFAGLLVLAPIAVNIVVYHLAHDLAGGMIAYVCGALYAVAAWGYADRFKGLLG
ncbi:MAG: hypothetical protein RL757_3265 [Bacteroidota bacterium]|jgi:uncharacterized membrane protein YphA (DoxX/SURF4 family)